LDAAAGIQWEGETLPEATAADVIASRAYGLLSNGMGGIDWAGLPIVAEVLHVNDVEDLIHRLGVIKTHKLPAER
jgi:hypothetical protein